jgi:hypothetical protein
MPKVDDRIQALEAKLKQLKVQQQRKEARARSVALHQSRRDELRRKILVGANVLAKVEDGSLEEAVLKKWLDPAVTRPEDRGRVHDARTARPDEECFLRRLRMGVWMQRYCESG